MLVNLYASPVTRLLAAGEVPNPTPKAPDGFQKKIDMLLGFGLTLVIAACVAGVFIVAGRMVIALRRNEFSEHVGGLSAVAAGCVLAGSASAVVRFFLL